MKPRAMLWLALALVASGLILLALNARKTITLVVDGQEVTRATYAATVADLLAGQGVLLGQEDLVQPPLDHRLAEGDVVRVARARPVQVWVEGEAQTLLTAEEHPANVLTLAGVDLYPGDRLLFDGEPIAPDQPLPPGPGTLQVQRAHPLDVTIGTRRQTLHSTAATLGQALWEAGITLHQADRVDPPLTTPLTGALQVRIRPARLLTVRWGDQSRRLRSAATTVGEALAEAGLALQGLDYSIPPADGPIPAEGVIELVRVREEVILEQQPLAFETVFQPAPELEIDNQQILEAGEFGLTARRVRVRYENGVEVDRQVEGEWVAVEPKPRVMGYGTKIVVRTMNTPDGPIEYWRAVTMYATSYSPCRIFADRCSSVTASGATLRKGIAAVVTYWYRFMGGSQVYVPGYGVASILDTGRGIPGRYWIDLGYSDDDFVNWHQWVTVYFLTPVPSPDRILYILN